LQGSAALIYSLFPDSLIPVEPCEGPGASRPTGPLSEQISRELFMKIFMILLVFLISGCVTVTNIHDLLTGDELARKDYYKCTQGVSIDIGSVGNAGGGAVLAPATAASAALSITSFLTAPMIFSSMHYKRTAVAPVVDITVVDAVNMSTISSYFTFTSYCRVLACDQPGKVCLEVDARLLGYDRDNDAAIAVTITKTPADGKFMREYTSYRKMKLKEKNFELTEISEAEALRIRDYYMNDYFPRSKSDGTRP